MAQIYPFRALRYDTDQVQLADVVTQPYDKITPAMQAQYYARSPYNLIRIILGEREPGDTDAFAPTEDTKSVHNVYTRAAESLRSWRREGILREDAEPALFGYEQTYTVPGTGERRQRRGLIALGQLYDYTSKVVYRHEQTFPKHKSDRLALFKATRAYCEQIYMLYSDPAFTAEELIFGNRSGRPATPADLQVMDEFGVEHRMWKLTDPRLINLIVTAMADKKLIIADGHHRYETSVAYMHERADELGLNSSGRSVHQQDEEDESPSNRADEPHDHLPRPAFPEAAMMMTLVNMDAPGITILPTHRVLFGISTTYAALVEAARPYFEIRVQADIDLTALGTTAGVAFVVVHPGGQDLWIADAEAVHARLHELHPEITERQLALDVVQLHRLVLEDLVGLSHESIGNVENIRYVRDSAEAAQQVRDGSADLAFLIQPVTLDQLRSISLSGDVMPQKSTDFYPKLLSGLAIYALDETDPN